MLVAAIGGVICLLGWIFANWLYWCHWASSFNAWSCIEIVRLSARFAGKTAGECQSINAGKFPGRRGCTVKFFETDGLYHDGMICLTRDE